MGEATASTHQKRKKRKMNKPQDKWHFWITAGYIAIIVAFTCLWFWAILLDEPAQLRRNMTNTCRTSVETISDTVPKLQNITQVDSFLSAIAKTNNCALILQDENGVVIFSYGKEETLEEMNLPILANTSATNLPLVRYVEKANSELFYSQKSFFFMGRTLIIRASLNEDSYKEALASQQTIKLGIFLTFLLLISITCFVCYQKALSLIAKMERVRARFFANASHELKTPIAGIKLLSESIKRSISQKHYDRIEDLSDRIDKETLHLQSLLDDIIELSNYENNLAIRNIQQNNPTEVINLKTIVERSFASRKIIAESKGLDFSFINKDEKRSLYLIRASTESASTIVNNLIDNAIQYTNKGFIAITIEAVDSRVLLKVIDSGEGITKREKEKIFERFYQVRKHHSTNQNSTGLGLAIVKDAVLMLNGKIAIESKPEEGSTFTVSFPLID